MNTTEEKTQAKQNIEHYSFEWCVNRIRKGLHESGFSVCEIKDDSNVTFLGEFSSSFDGQKKEFPFRLSIDKLGNSITQEMLVARNVQPAHRAAVAVLCCCYNAASNHGHICFDPFDGETSIITTFDPQKIFQSTPALEIKRIFELSSFNLYDLSSDINSVISGADPCMVFASQWQEEGYMSSADQNSSFTGVFKYDELEELVDKDRWSQERMESVG